MRKSYSLLLLLLVSEMASALTFGGVMENSLGPVTVVTKMMFLACYLTGFCFLISAIMQYQMFRANPKIAPLSRILLLTFFGILLVSLPLLSTNLGYERSWSATEMSRGSDSAISSSQIRY